MVCAWAALTSVSRVVMGRHYAGDVLAGAVLGTFELIAVRAAAPPMCAAFVK
jgi:membrane-associated phospholipid phosphatase